VLTRVNVANCVGPDDAVAAFCFKNSTRFKKCCHIREDIRRKNHSLIHSVRPVAAVSKYAQYNIKIQMLSACSAIQHRHLHSCALSAPTGSSVLISSRPVTLHPPPLTGISLDEPAREHICRDPYFHGAFLFLVGAVGWLVAAFLGVAYPSGIPVAGYDLGNW
jgi:hypothetical protein